MEDLSTNSAFQEIVSLVEKEMARWSKQRPSRTAGLLEEKRLIEQQVSGWSRSLGRLDLDDGVRRTLESDWGSALRRVAEIDKELAAEAVIEQRQLVDLDPQRVARQLEQLAAILASDNATAVNFELALHIDEIACGPDGQIEMRTCKLGIVPDLVELIQQANEESVLQLADVATATDGRVRNRRRTRLALTSDNRDGRDELMEFVLDPDRFAGLPSSFFWTDSFQVPERTTWPEDHADEVYQRKQESGRSNAALALEFDVSIPTLRKALKIGQLKAERGSDAA